MPKSVPLCLHPRPCPRPYPHSPPPPPPPPAPPTAGAAAAIAAVAALPIGEQTLTSSACLRSRGTRHTRPCMHGRMNEPPLESAFTPLHARIHLAAALARIYGARVHIVIEPAYPPGTGRCVPCFSPHSAIKGGRRWLVCYAALFPRRNLAGADASVCS